MLQVEIAGLCRVICRATHVMAELPVTPENRERTGMTVQVGETRKDITNGHSAECDLTVPGV